MVSRAMLDTDLVLGVAGLLASGAVRDVSGFDK